MSTEGPKVLYKNSLDIFSKSLWDNIQGTIPFVKYPCDIPPPSRTPGEVSPFRGTPTGREVDPLDDGFITLTKVKRSHRPIKMYHS